MYILQSRHSPYYPAQLLRPSFANMLANSTEVMKCAAAARACAEAKRDSESSNIHVIEETERFLLYADLPGVKAVDLHVELTNEGRLRIQGERKMGGEAIKFDRQFTVDDSLIETSSISASLADGSLEIVAPKKAASKSWRVAVVGGAPTEDDNEALSFEFDVPGVKMHALQVEVNDDGKLLISGERQKRGGQMRAIRKAFSLDRHAVDTEKVEAFLEDGVLTICAPKKALLVGRIIPVGTRGDAETMVEEIKKDSEGKKADSMVTIGTEAEQGVQETPPDQFHDEEEGSKRWRVAVVGGSPPEDDEALSFQLEVPGIKVHALQVEVDEDGNLVISGERKGGEQTTTHKAFSLDTDVVDAERVEAFLEDSVLTIRAPLVEGSSSDNEKEEEGTKEIEQQKEGVADEEAETIVHENPTEEFHDEGEASKSWRVPVVGGGTPAEDNVALSFALQLPAVKVDALQVEVNNDGKLLISGDRKLGGEITTIHRAFSLNKAAVDTKRVEAYLEDGVLVIRAPKKEYLVDDTAGKIADKTTTKEIESELYDAPSDKDSATDASTEEEKSATDSSLYSDYEVVPETVSEDDE